MSADPDRPCPHESFQANVEVSRITEEEGGPVVAYYADVRVWCVDCDEPFRFTGVDVGMMPSRPMASVDHQELRAPIRPATSDPDFGMGLPGFTMRLAEDGVVDIGDGS